MEPQAGRIAFNLALFLLVLISFSLLIVKKDTAEFTVGIIAFCVSLIFLGFVVWDVRRQASASHA